MANRIPACLIAAVLIGAAFPSAARPQDTGDTVVTTERAEVHRVPSAESEVQATLEAGTTVEVHSRREGWLAVSTPDGTVGWIELRFARLADAAAETPTPAPSSGPPPARPGAQPVTGSTSFTPPPPPPARPPTRNGGASAGTAETTASSSARGGFYGRKGWARLSFAVVDGGPGGGLAWGTMLSRIVEWRMAVSGWKRTEGDIPGSDLLSGGSGVTSPITSDDPLYSLGLGAALRFFVLQPSEDLPLGVHIGAAGAWNQYFASERPDVSDYNTFFYGGEGGVYYRGPRAVVRGSVQVGPRTAKLQDESGSETVVNFTVGIEPRISDGFTLSALFHRLADQNVVEVGLTFPYGN